MRIRLPYPSTIQYVLSIFRSSVRLQHQLLWHHRGPGTRNRNLISRRFFNRKRTLLTYIWHLTVLLFIILLNVRHSYSEGPATYLYVQDNSEGKLAAICLLHSLLNKSIIIFILDHLLYSENWILLLHVIKPSTPFHSILTYSILSISISCHHYCRKLL